MADYGGGPYGGSPYGGPSTSGGSGGGSPSVLAPALNPVRGLVEPVLPLPYEITNLLSEEQQTISGVETSPSLVSGWSVGEGCYLIRSTRYQKFDPASLEVVVSSSGTAWVHTGSNDADYITVTPGVTYRAFAWVRTEALRRTVRIGIEWANLAYESLWDADTYYTEMTVGVAGEWTLISYTGVAPQTSTFTTRRARIRIELPDAGPLAPSGPSSVPLPSQVLWIDDAVLTEYHQTMSGFSRLVYRWLPEYLRLLDEEATEPNIPMARYVDLIGATGNRMLSAAVAFDYVPAEDGVVGFERSTLVNPEFYNLPNMAEEAWLPWLAFITGTRAYISPTLVGGIYSPWYAIEELSGDPSSWDTLEAFGSSPPTWDELEEYDPIPQDATISLREAIRTQGTGIYAGTVEGIRRAARLVLNESGVTYDAPAFVTRRNGYAVATFDTVLNLAPSDLSECYNSGVSDLDGPITITDVSDNGLTIRFVSDGDDISLPVRAYFTNKVVNIVPQEYAFVGDITGSNPGGIGTLTISVTRPLPELVDEIATVTIVNGGAYTGSYTTSAIDWDGVDTLTLTVGGTVATSTASDAQISISYTFWGLVVETVATQTPDADLVLAAAGPAKPVGCVLSHRYTT